MNQEFESQRRRDAETDLLGELVFRQRGHLGHRRLNYFASNLCVSALRRGSL